MENYFPWMAKEKGKAKSVFDDIKRCAEDPDREPETVWARAKTAHNLGLINERQKQQIHNILKR